MTLGRRVTFGALALTGSLAIGCKREPPAPAPAAFAPEELPAEAPSASLPAPPAEPSRPGCRRAVPGASFAISEASGDPDGGDDAVPFAVEIGSAAARDGGFAVGALRARGGGAGAVVALLDADASSGRIVELGPVHGDQDPPRVAARGQHLVVVVPNADAGANTLEVVDVGESGPVRGPTFRTGRDDSHAFDVALGDEATLVAWDELDRPKGHSVVRLAALVADRAPLTRLASPAKTDAAEPRLVPRDGGFWLAWIAHALAEGDRTPTGGDGGSQERVTRWLEVVPLDRLGAPTAEPRAVTDRAGTVSTFDLAATSDGHLLVAWRKGDDRAAGPGSSASLGVVRADGTVHESPLPDQDLGPGAPALVVDGTSKPRKTWLAVASVTDATRLAPLSIDGTVAAPLAADPTVGRAEPVAAGHGRILFASGRGRAVELTAMSCGDR